MTAMRRKRNEAKGIHSPVREARRELSGQEGLSKGDTLESSSEGCEKSGLRKITWRNVLQPRGAGGVW